MSRVESRTIDGVKLVLLDRVEEGSGAAGCLLAPIIALPFVLIGLATNPPFALVGVTLAGGLLLAQRLFTSPIRALGPDGLYELSARAGTLSIRGKLADKSALCGVAPMGVTSLGSEVGWAPVLVVEGHPPIRLEGPVPGREASATVARAYALELDLPCLEEGHSARSGNLVVVDYDSGSELGLIWVAWLFVLVALVGAFSWLGKLAQVQILPASFNYVALGSALVAVVLFHLRSSFQDFLVVDLGQRRIVSIRRRAGIDQPTTLANFSDIVGVELRAGPTGLAPFALTSQGGAVRVGDYQDREQVAELRVQEAAQWFGLASEVAATPSVEPAPPDSFPAEAGSPSPSAEPSAELLSPPLESSWSSLGSDATRVEPAVASEVALDDPASPQEQSVPGEEMVEFDYDSVLEIGLKALALLMLIAIVPVSIGSQVGSTLWLVLALAIFLLGFGGYALRSGLRDRVVLDTVGKRVLFLRSWFGVQSYTIFARFHEVLEAAVQCEVDQRSRRGGGTVCELYYFPVLALRDGRLIVVGDRSRDPQPGLERAREVARWIGCPVTPGSEWEARKVRNGEMVTVTAGPSRLTRLRAAAVAAYLLGLFALIGLCSWLQE